MNDGYHVAPCPLVAICRWRSDPLPSAMHAREALRSHINTHRHSDLVDHVMDPITVENYERAAS